MKSKKPLFNIIRNIEIPKKYILVAISISSISSIIELLIPLFTGNLIDSLNSNSFHIGFVMIFICIFILNTILSGIGMYILSKIGENIIYSIRSLLWDHILKLNIKFYDKNESGQLLSRIIDDTKVINNFISLKVPQLVPSMLIVIGSMAMLFILDWKLTLTIFIIIVCFLLCMYPLGQIMEKVSNKTQQETANLSGLITRILSNIYIVKTSSTEDVENENGNKRLMNIYKLGLRQAKINSLLEPLSSLLIMLLVALILSIGTWRVSQGSISSGTLVAMIFYVFQLISPLSNLVSLMTDYKKAQGASERISGILNEIQENLNLKSKYVDVYGDIYFDNVSFSYDNITVLENLNFSIPQNKITAFVGPSGSGKSTILKLIEKLYDIDSGQIFIGNTSIDKINLLNWRKKLGYVIQENSMLNGTIKENILYGNHVNNWRKVNLDYYTSMTNCKEFIESFPKGYKTEIGENGTKISGGQKQRLSITRALIKEPEYLLLDEVTSNLDSESERQIQDSLQKVMKNKTSIIVAHRLSTIKQADQIVFLDQGKITGIGTHSELLTQHPKYKKFVLTQEL